MANEYEVIVPEKDKAYWAKKKPCKAHKNKRPCGEVNWDVGCENCDEKPVVCETGMCGPCTFGDADTAGGNW